MARGWLAEPSLKEYIGVTLRVKRPDARVMVTKASIKGKTVLSPCPSDDL